MAEGMPPTGSTLNAGMNWYAIYTNPRSEKKVAAELIRRGTEAYLPLVRTLRQWSDRKKWVEEPLFRSYVFVHITPGQYYDILNADGVVRYVTFEKKAVVVPPQQIEAVKRFIDQNEDIVGSVEQFSPGKTVEVSRGPLKGLLGELVNVKGKHRVRIEVAAVGQSVFLTMPMSYLRVISQ